MAHNGQRKMPRKRSIAHTTQPRWAGACWASLQPGGHQSKTLLSSVPLPPSDQHTGLDTPHLPATPSLHQPMSLWPALSHPSRLCINVTFSLRMPFALLKLRPLPQPYIFPLPALLFSTAFYAKENWGGYTNFRQNRLQGKTVTRDKEHCSMIKGSIHQKDNI